MTQPARLANIQALRALAALMVVAIHLQANELRASTDPLLTPWLYHGVAGVDLFFVISGFIMVHVTHGRFGDIRQAARFWFDRAVRVYPPVWLFTALALLGFYFQGSLSEWLGQSGLIQSFLLIPQESEPLLGVSWTLIHELYFYLVFGLFLFTSERWLPVWLAIWALIVTIGLAAGIRADSNPWLVVIFHPHTYEFLMGAGVALLFRRGWYRGPIFIAALGVIAFGLGLWWLGLRGPVGYPAFFGRVFAFGPPAALLVLGFAGLEKAGQFTAPRWMQTLGNWSYSLYLSHLLVIAALAHIWMRFSREGALDNIVMIIVMLTASVIFAGLAYQLYEKPTLWLGRQFANRYLPKKR